MGTGRPARSGRRPGRGALRILPASRPLAAGLLTAALMASDPGTTAFLAAAPAAAQTAPPAISFLPEEEVLFRDLLARDPAAPVTLKDPPAIGAMIPIEVPLQPFPDRVMAEVPATRGLRYVKTAAGVIVVDPDTRRVVQVLALGARP